VDDTNKTFQEVTRRTLHRGRKFDFEQVVLRTPAGEEFARECVRHPGAVVILPILEAPGLPPRIVFVRNERFALGKALLELPAGTREQGEDPTRTAHRELLEETGYQAATLTPLSRFHTTPGMTDELMWAYAASGLTHLGQRPEPDEALSVVLIDARDALAMASDGRLADAKSIATILIAHQRGLFTSSPPH